MFIAAYKVAHTQCTLLISPVVHFGILEGATWVLQLSELPSGGVFGTTCMCACGCGCLCLCLCCIVFQVTLAVLAGIFNVPEGGVSVDRASDYCGIGTTCDGRDRLVSLEHPGLGLNPGPLS